MPFLQDSGASSPSACQSQELPRKRTFGFQAKLPHPFWKSKSKSSVCSESQGSVSTTSDVGSPPFTPDSSLSIYTNSVDSDCSNSSTNSNQVSPKNSMLQGRSKSKTGGAVVALEDQLSTYSYNNDCERYAANMYYDMGDASSFECRVPVERPRNISVPLTPSFDENDCVHSYYNNSTFSTFPSPRRHSVGYSSYSSSLSSNQSTASCKREEMIELLPLPSGQDGYLIPISGPSSRRTNQFVKKNFYVNDCVRNAVVEVDVHVSDPSELSSIDETTSLGQGARTVSYTLSTGESLTASNDSGSTATIVSPTEQAQVGRDKMLPLCMSRILLAASDCEPFCSLCAASVVPSPTKTAAMDVAIVSCQECFFSRVISDKIQMFFERMVTPDNQRIDITLQVYDVRDLDNHTVAAEVHRAKVQIVIISNHFLEKLRHEALSRKKLSPVNRALRSKRVIAILTGTSAAEIAEGNQAGLVRFNEWFTLELRSASKIDGDFCKKFTDQVVKIYNVELNNNNNFSVFPKKATRNQPKVVVMLKKPLRSEDVLRIEFTRGRDTVELNNVLTANPYTTIIRIPESLCAEKTSLLEVTLFVNQQKLGTKLVKYEYQAKSGEDDIIDKMAKAVPGFQKLLDDHVSQTLSKNFRECTDWSLDPELELVNDVLVSKGDDFPTLMHFSAYYGLEQTVWTLLDEADGFEQCSLRNDVNETPLDIAQGNVEQIIKDYQEMTMSWKAFQFVKDLVTRNNDDAENTLRFDVEVSETRNGEETNGFEISQDTLNYTQLDPSSDSEEVTEESIQQKGKVIVRGNDHTRKSAVPDVAGIHHGSAYANINSQSETNAFESREKRQRLKDSFPPSIRKRRNPCRDYKVCPINYVNIASGDAQGSTNLVENAPSQSSDATDAPQMPYDPAISSAAPSIDDGYDIPRLDAYEIPPPGARPVNQNPVALMASQQNGDNRPDSSGYIPMSPPKNSEIQVRPGEEVLKVRLPSDKETCQPPLAVLQRKSSKSDSADEELIEILNDFKNNAYGMKELESLFDGWKKRSDVKMSYQERQARLKQFRCEYNLIQDKLSKGQRRPSVLDKVLKFFYSGRKKTPSNASSTPSVPDISGSPESELNGRNTSNRNERKFSNNSDRVSLESNHSAGMSDSDSVFSSKEKSWVNPMTRKCVQSYVEPQSVIKPTAPAEIAQTQISRTPPAFVDTYENDIQTPYYKEPPPPRPVKHNATPLHPLSVERNSPPRSPKTVITNGMKGNFPVEKLPAPPLPPPRTEKAPPVRFIRYEKRPSDGFAITEMNNDGSRFPLAKNGLPSVKQPYENANVDGDKRDG